MLSKNQIIKIKEEARNYVVKIGYNIQLSLEDNYEKQIDSAISLTEQAVIEEIIKDVKKIKFPFNPGSAGLGMMQSEVLALLKQKQG